MIEILHACPPYIATGGTEGIHHLVSELNKHPNIHARVWYRGNISKTRCPQPKEYISYHCEYVTELPPDFTGVIIFPEIWANEIVKYRKQKVAVNWQGVDVYDWNVPKAERGKFLQRKDAIYITMSEYGMDHLRNLGLDPIKIPDCINDKYLEDYMEPEDRKSIVLYNPVQAKMTKFQEIVMAKCRTELGIRFQPLSGYSQEQLIHLMRHSKLYIDFGAFSGRERLPREAVMCGCCILTSKSGTAGYYEDNKIPGYYKIDTNDFHIADEAVKKVKAILQDYSHHRPDFDNYRLALRHDKNEYPEAVRRLGDALFHYYTGT